jgi:hypothetical protein
MCWMGAAVISELEGGQLGYVKMRIGPVSSIGHRVHAGVIELPCRKARRDKTQPGGCAPAT